MTAPALVHRLIEEAERRAEKGHRQAALRLATLALDFGGGEAALLWRSLGVRDTALANSPGASNGALAAAPATLGGFALPALPAPGADGRIPTIFGTVPIESPFGDDGPILHKPRPMLPGQDRARRAARRTTILRSEDPLAPLEASNSPLFAAITILIAATALGGALAQPLEAGMLLDRMGWHGGAVYFVERAAGSLTQSAEAHATLGAWHLERGLGVAAVTHYRRAAQMGLAWERIPEIIAALKDTDSAEGAGDVLIAAFGAGAPREAWPIIVQELTLLGRRDEARNVRQMMEFKR